MRIRVLGTRGSMAVEGSEYAVFGGSTSCYLVEAGDHSVILDAGSGLLRAPLHADDASELHVLLSHAHLDHVLGLGMFARLSVPGARTCLHVPAASEEQARAVLDALYGPPFWPVGITTLGGEVRVDVVPDTLAVGDVLVDFMEGNHPGGCKVIRVRHENKTLVYATDYEYEESSFERLVEFSRGADLVLYDAQYRDAELGLRTGFGHSSPRLGVELKHRSGARHMLLIHHDPASTDEMLLRRERELGRADIRYAREGEAIEL